MRSWSDLGWLVGLVAVVAVVLAACSDESVSVEESNLSITTEGAAAATASSAEPSTTVASTVESTVAARTEETDLTIESVDPSTIEPVAFSTDIQPILERSCASCHGPAQAGSSGFVLSTAAEAVEHAMAIEIYTSTRLMPPWPASDRSLPFHDDPSLTAMEIAKIARWVSDGAELDVDPADPITSVAPLSSLENPDVVMTASGGAYAGDPESRDDYRCLVFDPGTTEREWILATHFVPDVDAVVHHGIIKLATADLRERAAELDASTPEVGWSCYGGTGLEGRGGSLRDMDGWAPGQLPQRWPDGYAVPLEPGDFFVVQVHYHYDGEAPADLSAYHLDFASDDEIDAAGGSFGILDQELYLGPAEIPCYEGDTEPLCDRGLARERVRSLYGPLVGAFADLFMAQCGARIEDFAAMTNGDASSTCDLPVRNPGRVTSVFGHMHELGSSIRLTLNPDTPDEQILLDIPDWDFEWQMNYRPVDDVVINTGDVIRVDCAWNRELAPYEAVGYILWSDGTGDEMCYSSITTAPLD